MKPEEEYQISEFMNKDVVQVPVDTTAKQAAEIMAAEKVSSAIVTQSNQIAGIVTEKDFARKIVAKGLNPNDINVQDIMTSEVITIEPDATLYDAMLLLNEKKIKHLPVVADHVVVGVITAMDILKIQPSYMELLASKSKQ